MEIAHLVPSELDPKIFDAYQTLAKSEWIHYLNSSPSPSTLLIGMEIERRPVGLCICSHSRMYGYCDLAYLNIEAGAATRENFLALLSYVAEQGRACGSRYLTLLTPAESDNEDGPLNQALKLMGWMRPVLWSQRLTFDCRDFRPDWLYRGRNDNPGLEIFPWGQLIPEERVQVERYVDQYNLPAFLSPFWNPESIQWINSLGLRHKNGRILGWMITHTPPDFPDRIDYACYYVDPEVRISSMSIQLLREAILLQQKSGLPYAQFDVSLRDSDPSWLHFVEKRLVPQALKTTTFVQQKYIL